MIVVESYPLAVTLCFVTMFCWGSWANTQKLAGKTWRFELFYWDYVFGVMLMALLFAGAVILFAFVRFVGHEPLWQALLGDAYQRVIKQGIEEFIELMGYFLWIIGSIEYAIEARAVAYRTPQPVARKRRDQRRAKKTGRRS